MIRQIKRPAGTTTEGRTTETRENHSDAVREGAAFFNAPKYRGTGAKGVQRHPRTRLLCSHPPRSGTRRSILRSGALFFDIFPSLVHAFSCAVSAETGLPDDVTQTTKALHTDN